MSKLEELTEKSRKEWDELNRTAEPVIYLGMASCGKAAGAMATKQAILDTLLKHGIKARLIEVGCIGTCYLEPLVDIKVDGNPRISYGNVDAIWAVKIIEEYLVRKTVPQSKVLGQFGQEDFEGIPQFFDQPMLSPQVRIVTKNCGFIDPERIEHYLANEGYQGLKKTLSMKPEEVIEEITRAGLRGRGGAGFPTGIKWRTCREAKGEMKYLICNADEGDPGAFMNRLLIESDPHALLEGMLIAAYAIGAKKGYIYIRAEYPLAIERLKKAIGQMSELRLLGEKIAGSDFSFDLVIKEGAGAFVCGEETSLIHSIEGKRGMPRTRPPFPALSGLHGKPTVINNVETLGTVPHILRNGASWYHQFGIEGNFGTKTFSLVGKICRPGLIEVPLGITLRKIIFDIGGGTQKPFKAVQSGGPSGGCIPERLLDTPVTYESLGAIGSIMGSGGLIVMDSDTCVVDLARYFLDFIQNESCGKCTPCRVGTRHMVEILDSITRGLGDMASLDKLESLARMIKSTSLCGLGQSAPNPVLTTLRYFRNEYEAHIKYKKCPAVVCKEIISSPCQHICPIDTEASVYAALIAKRRFREAFDIILKDNPLPSVCGRVCDHQCEAKCLAGKWGKSIAIRALKRFAADGALNEGAYPAKREVTRGGEKVAIVGSGPSGLTCGYYLALKGYDVTILESMDVPGGAMAAYIPKFRLPLDILNIDIQNIKNAGVKIRTGIKVGKDITFDTLLKENRALFIATGSHKSHAMNIPGEESEGVFDALEFLKDVNLNKKAKVGKRVGVIGGGNAAIDAARAAIRLKECEKVILLYRRTRVEMPAIKEEIEDAIREGVELRCLTAPKIVLAENGKVTGVECLRCELCEQDESGRRRPVPIQCSEFTVELDSLIVAIGESPDLNFLGQHTGGEISRWGTIVVDEETLATSIPGVFAGGDVVTGASTVVNAISSGKRAACMIDHYVKGEPLTWDYGFTRPSIFVPAIELTEEEIENADRPEIPTLSLDECMKNFLEVEKNLTEEMAIKEARRCLRCDLGTEDAKRCIEQMKECAH